MESANKAGADRQTLIASIGALASLVAASTCCLPLIPFLAAAGAAGGSVFLAEARPYLLVLSGLLIAYGLYQGRRARQCGRHPRRAARILLWFSAAVVLVSVLFPQFVAGLLAG